MGALFMRLQTLIEKPFKRVFTRIFHGRLAVVKNRLLYCCIFKFLYAKREI